MFSTKNVLFCFMIATVLLSANSNLIGGDASISKPEINLSSVIPVVNRELEIRLDNAPAGQEIYFSIAYEGKDVLKEKAKPDDGKIIRKWTPKETGFYTALFSFGTEKVSLEFPVVYKEIYFVAWPPVEPSERDLRYLSSYVVCNEKDIPYWKSRGSKTLDCTAGMSRIDMGISEEEAIKKAVDYWSAPIKKGFDGIFMDEFGEYPLPEGLKKVERAGKALIQLRKENPDMLIFPNIGGGLLREESIYIRQSGSIALLETYPNCFIHAWGTHSWRANLDHRVMVARNTDAIWDRRKKHGTLILLGIGCDGGGRLVPEMEDDVRYIKKTAPEMPGIGFVCGAREKQYALDTGLRKAADDLCLKYYIKPVADIREIFFSNYTPCAGQNVDIFIRVHNLGGMDAKNVKLRLYAVESGRGKKIPIGEEIIIKKIGTGWVDIELNKEDKPRTYYEYREIEGNTYPIFQTAKKWGSNIIWIDRHVIKVSWKPGEKGCYTIIAELKPSDNYTILDGFMEKKLVVQ